jgi:hypothetical protein
MPRTKYDKYITSDVLFKDPKNPNASVMSTRHLEGKWGGGHLSADTIYIAHPHVMITQPHVHEFPQYLHFFSANPRDARDFDAEIEVCLGEEQEKHIIKAPAAIYVPAGVPHGPISFAKVNKPFLFIDIAVSGKYSRVGNTPD